MTTVSRQFPGLSRSGALVLAVAPLGLLSCLVGFLGYQGHRLLSPEVLVLGLAVAALGVVAGGAALATGRPGRAVLIAIVFTLVADYAGLTRGLALPGRVVLPALFAAALVLSWWLGARAARVFATVFGVILVAALVLPAERVDPAGEWRRRPPPPARDLPVVVHIILDGQIGVAGIPAEVPGGPELRHRLREFYGAHGFRLFERTFSRYRFSGDAIPNLLNFSASPEHAAYMSAAGQPPIRRLRFFERLGQAGYRIRVYQSDALDYCSSENAPVSTCVTYPYRSIAWLDGLALPLADKIAVLATAFLKGSMMVRAAGRLTTSAAGGPPWPALPAPTFAAVRVPRLLQRLAADVVSGGRGNYYFVHLLLPHRPYAFDGHCNVRPSLSAWDVKPDAGVVWPRRFSGNNRRQAYRLYFQQVDCVHRLLDKFLREIGSHDRLEDTVVIVHGDHGSRIAITLPSVEAAHAVSDADYVDAYSTLLAVRAPGLEAGRDPRSSAIDRIFWDTVLPVIGLDGLDGLAALPGGGQVFLQAGAGRPMVAVEWPGFGDGGEPASP